MLEVMGAARWGQSATPKAAMANTIKMRAAGETTESMVPVADPVADPAAEWLVDVTRLDRECRSCAQLPADQISSRLTNAPILIAVFVAVCVAVCVVVCVPVSRGGG